MAANPPSLCRPYKRRGGRSFGVPSIFVLSAQALGAATSAAGVAFLDKLPFDADTYYGEQIAGDFSVFVAPAGYPAHIVKNFAALVGGVVRKYGVFPGSGAVADAPFCFHANLFVEVGV